MNIDGVVLTELESHGDERGRFTEIVRSSALSVGLVQASHSHSKVGVLRGLHFHLKQSDLWYLASGRAQVALVDLRSGSGTPVVETLVLDAANPATLFIPPGVAHGYLALTDIDMLYWTSHEWDPADEQGIAWDDPALGIGWQSTSVVVSDRDRSNRRLDWADIPRF